MEEKSLDLNSDFTDMTRSRRDFGDMLWLLFIGVAFEGFHGS